LERDRGRGDRACAGGDGGLTLRASPRPTAWAAMCLNRPVAGQPPHHDRWLATTTRTWLRASRQSLAAAPLSGVGVQTINQFAKFPARLEERNSLRRHFDLGSGFWIAPDAPASLARVEASEAADFNLIAGSQGTDDAVEYGADDDVGFLQGHPNGLVKLFGQIGPGHMAHLRRITKKSITGLPGARARHLGPAQPVAQGIAGASRSLRRRPVTAPRRPRSGAAPGGARMGIRGRAEGAASMMCWAGPVRGVRSSPRRDWGRRRAAVSPGRRRAACTPVAQVRRAVTSGWPKSVGSGCHNALCTARCRPPVPAPAARSPSS